MKILINQCDELIYAFIKLPSCPLKLHLSIIRPQSYPIPRDFITSDLIFILVAKVMSSEVNSDGKRLVVATNILDCVIVLRNELSANSSNLRHVSHLNF